MSNTLKWLVVCTLFLLIGAAAGYFLASYKPSPKTKDIRSNSSGYQFINPLLECDNVNIENATSMLDAKSQVEQLIEDQVYQGRIVSASVYYRDLNNGPWFGINMDEHFSPASLVKVPVLIAFLKEAETSPGLLERSILIEEEPRYDDQNFKPEQRLVKGESYSYRQLLERMIVYSDNVAYDLLLNNFDLNKLSRVYQDLGVNIEDRADQGPDGDVITVREYSSFFRILFNASYLNHDSSETALRLLSEVQFDQGLLAGLAKGTKVAHKFGERRYLDTGLRQLHDCGIIYISRSPYLLCVMSRGYDFGFLEVFISDVTRIIDVKHSGAS